MAGEKNSKPVFQADGINLSVHDFYVDSSSVMAQKNLLFATAITFSADSIQNNAPEKGKQFFAIDIQGSTAEKYLTIGNIELDADTCNSDSQPSHILLGAVSLEGVDFYKLVTKKKIDLQKLEFTQPDLIINRPPLSENIESETSQHFNFYEYFADHLHEIKAKDVIINHAKLDIRDTDTANSNTYLFEQVDLKIKNILIDSSNRIFENKFLYSDDLSFSVRNYTETTPDSLYSFGAEHIFFSSNNATLIVDSGFLSPNYNDSVFFARVGVQTDKFDFAFDRLNMRNLRLVDLITDNTFWMDKLELDGLHGSDFRNKIYPKPKNHHPKMPATALRSLNFDLLIDSLVVQNSQFTYREYLPPALKPGEIWFTDINISGKNITNNSEKIEMDSLMSFDVNAKIMGEGDLSLTFNFDIENNNNNWEAVGKLKYFDLTHLNPMLENAAFVKVTKGYNDFLKFKISANRQLATGNMTFGYEKLHIRLIDKKTLLTSGIDESIASFIANTFVVRRNNPRFPFRTRQGEIFFRRDSTKSYFNYFTKATLSGINSTIRGGNEERREQRKKRAMKRQLNKEGKLDDEIMKELNINLGESNN